MSVLRQALLPWTCRWNLLRLGLAAMVVWVLAADTGARLARLRLAAMPDFDFAAEVHALRLEGRYGEADMIAAEGLRSATGPARDAIQAQRDAAAQERDSWLRRAKDLGLGALTGSGRSLEGLVGAVAADMLVVGDVRDLLVQGGKQLIDGDSDEVVLALSVVGLVTTVAPEVDWAPSVLKAARRTGHLGDALGKRLVTIIKGRKAGELSAVLGDVALTARRTSPGTAVRALSLADEPADLARIARFAQRPGAGLALHVDAPGAWRVVRSGVPEAEAALVKAARKGPAGVRYLESAGRVLTRPHPLLGIAKALWKGNAQAMITRLTDRIDPSAWWMLPAAGAWLLLELGLLIRKVSAARSPAE